MKRLFTLLALASALSFAACSQTGTSTPAAPTSQPDRVATVATAVSTGISLLPAKLVSEVRLLVAEHPAARPYLVTVANGLESIAKAGAKLPSPDATFNTLVAWTEFIPQVGAYVSDFATLYRRYYGDVAPTTAALTQLAELIRSTAG